MRKCLVQFTILNSSFACVMESKYFAYFFRYVFSPCLPTYLFILNKFLLRLQNRKQFTWNMKEMINKRLFLKKKNHFHKRYTLSFLWTLLMFWQWKKKEFKFSKSTATQLEIWNNLLKQCECSAQICLEGENWESFLEVGFRMSRRFSKDFLRIWNLTHVLDRKRLYFFFL